MEFEHYDGRKKGQDGRHLYCIYKITINGKKYIGQTNYTIVRFSKHRTIPGCAYIYNAIQTYGWENAKVEILLVDLTLEEANRLETHYIENLGTLVPGGYNLKRGGDNNEWSEEARKALSETMKIKWGKSPMLREVQSMVMKKLRESNDFQEATRKSLDKFWSDETREAQSEKMKKQWDDQEYRKKRSEEQSKHMKERWGDEQYHSKLSISQRNRYEKEEEREKARQSHGHMRKFTDEELIIKDEELKGSVAKLSEYFDVSKCVISRHKKRLELTGKCYK